MKTDKKRTKRVKQNGGPPVKDECQTPIYGLAPVLELLQRFYIKKTTHIWESFAGEGILFKELRRAGWMVLGSELKTSGVKKCPGVVYGVDFFEDLKRMKQEGINLIVSNLPFSKKYKILKTLYANKMPFFLLVPLDTLGAKQAQDLFKKYGIHFIFLDHRINFKMPFKGWSGTADFATLWLWWDGVSDPDRIEVTFAEINQEGERE